MGQATRSTERLATAQERLERRTQGVRARLSEWGQELAGDWRRSMTGALTGLFAFEAALGSIRGLIGGAAAALDEFADTQARAFTARFAFRGVEGLFDRMNDLAGAASRLSGIDDDLILSQTQLFHQLGLGEQRIRGLIDATADLARANRLTFEQASDAVVQALVRREAGVRKLGVEYKRTGNLARDALALEAAIAREFGGAAAGFRGTFAGQREALGTEVGNLRALIGEQLARGVSPLTEFLIRNVQAINQNQNQVRDTLRLLPSFLGGDFFRALLPPGGPSEAPALGGGRGGNPKTRIEALLEEIARNTGAGDPLIRQVLGGGGEAARRALNIRSAQISFRNRT